MGIFKPNIEKLVKEGNTAGLLKALKHRKPEIRIKVFNTLFDQREDGDIEKQLRSLIDDDDVRVRNAAILKYSQSGDHGLLSKIQDIVVNGSQNEKVEALRTLADWDPSRASDVASIVVLGLNDKKPMIQIEAIRTMGDMKDKTAVYHLEERLHEGVYTVRLESVRALGKIGTDAAVDLLIGSLTDSKVEVRRESRESLEKIGTERAMKALNNAPFMLMVKRMNESVTSKQEVIKHISKNKLKEALPLIRKACSDEYKSVRVDAVKTIGILRDKDSMNILKKCIEDPYFDIRLEAVRTLEKLICPQSLAALEKVMDDFNKNVRDEARRAYYHVKARLEEQEKN